jgi:hypothetical protein
MHWAGRFSPLCLPGIDEQAQLDHATSLKGDVAELRVMDLRV